MRQLRRTLFRAWRHAARSVHQLESEIGLMRVVIFSDMDMEPLTAIDLDERLIQIARQMGVVTLSVPPELSISEPLYEPTEIPLVRLRPIFLKNGNLRTEYPVFVTRDENEVLRLSAVLLSGQERALNARIDRIVDQRVRAILAR